MDRRVVVAAIVATLLAVVAAVVAFASLTQGLGLRVDTALVAMAAVVQALTAIAVVALTWRLAVLNTTANRNAQLQAEYSGMAILEADLGASRTDPDGSKWHSIVVTNRDVRPAIMVSIHVTTGAWQTGAHSRDWAAEMTNLGPDSLARYLSAISPGRSYEYWFPAVGDEAFYTIKIHHGGMFGGQVMQVHQYARWINVAPTVEMFDLMIAPSIPGAEWLRRSEWGVPEYRDTTPTVVRRVPPRKGDKA